MNTLKVNKIKELIKEELKRKLKEDYNPFPKLNEEEILTDQPEVTYDIDDQIGNFWIVKKAMKESTDGDLVMETDLFGLAEMINQQQVSRADIHGIYKMENKARRVSSTCIGTRDRDISDTIKEGNSTMNALEKAIEDIKMDIEAVTQRGVTEPSLRDSVAADLDVLYAKLGKKEELQARLQSSLDKEVEENKEYKKSKKDNKK